MLFDFSVMDKLKIQEVEIPSGKNSIISIKGGRAKVLGRTTPN